MRNLLLVAAVLILLSSCGRRNVNRDAVTETETTIISNNDTRRIDIVDSLRIQEGMGEVVERVFSGEIPGADVPGIQYTITLWHQKFVNNGVYELEMTYREAENGQDRTYTSSGRYQTLLSSNREVIQLRPYDQTIESEYFLVINEERLRMLDSQMQEIESQHNYDLTLQPFD